VNDPDPLKAAELALGARGGLRAAFPAAGDGPVRFTLPDGFALQVREPGPRRAARPHGNSMVYDHGDSPGALLLERDRRRLRGVAAGARGRRGGESHLRGLQATQLGGDELERRHRRRHERVRVPLALPKAGRRGERVTRQ
jgi:hypothetical protein